MSAAAPATTGRTTAEAPAPATTTEGSDVPFIDPAASDAGRAAPHRLTPPPYWGDRVGNDDVELVPSHGVGRGLVAFDFPGVAVGTAEYANGPTGATVITIAKGARTSVDARGGAIGIIGRYEEFNHAICFAGGSSYGLAAATGVDEELLVREEGRVGWQDLRSASGAVIYDLGARDTGIVPDAALGRAALEAARSDVIPVGRVGAGIAASAGKIDLSRCEFTGQGAAFRQIGDLRILVVTIVNPVGVIVDRDGRIVRGNYDPETGERRLPVVDYEAALLAGEQPVTAAGNTTITAVVTNVKLDDKELRLFGRQVHSSMHRAIQPFHTNHDGDTLFALTTDEIALPPAGSTRLGEQAVNSIALAAVASELAWDAVLEAGR
ncbi:P1 family peptidase [Agromyces mediolanus]|uniref:P1 family peptidase n=1 Tax=Agromyces mediolanus TaxID=41986 RepID=UPI00203C4C26|nr:P1 family peptidase [Agromyces mediolanus]MCM3657816.1 P1 family peptidase [Agromyces mediolanus]